VRVQTWREDFNSIVRGVDVAASGRSEVSVVMSVMAARAKICICRVETGIEEPQRGRYFWRVFDGA
jgi:hypothetical protein